MQKARYKRKTVGRIVVQAAIALAPSLLSAQARQVRAPQLKCPQLALPLVPSLDCAYHCGSDRWTVKTMTDADWRRVELRAVPTTIQALNRLPRPARRPAARRTPAELRTYCVDAWLVGIRPQDDGDLHLELIAPDDTGSKILAEVPDARCNEVCKSTFATAFARARAAIEARVARDPGDELRIRMRITGVAFFDRNHGQIGAARNFLELHPVLAVSFP